MLLSAIFVELKDRICTAICCLLDVKLDVSCTIIVCQLDDTLMMLCTAPSSRFLYLAPDHCLSYTDNALDLSPHCSWWQASGFLYIIANGSVW